jgi:hypothetical protein
MYDPLHTISDAFLPGATSLLNGLAYPGQSGSPIKSLYPRDLNNFAPRLGFAFTPSRNGKTVIRGAWGVYYDVPNGNLIIDNRAAPGGRGVSRNPGPDNLNPVFDISNPDNHRGRMEWRPSLAALHRSHLYGMRRRQECDRRICRISVWISSGK